jgi:hypothetical protein
MSDWQIYYNKNIQMDKRIIQDIYESLKCHKNPKMLVFGLGYDSKLWYNITNKNTFFVEHNQEYIDLNKDIADTNIIKYDYNDISVSKSMNILKNKSFSKDLDQYKIPEKLLEQKPFDIIIIDGPTGYNNECPGRLLPIYWSKTILSKSGTIIYVDDSNRPLENKSIKTIFNSELIRYSKIRDGCSKIIIK